MKLLKFCLLMIGLLQYRDISCANQPKSNLSPDHIAVIAPTAALATAGYFSYQRVMQPKKFIINVEKLTEKNLKFPKIFAWGVSTSATQIEESHEHHDWSQTYLDTHFNASHAKHHHSKLQSPGFASESFSQWQDDIDKVAYLGANAYRFSIDWSRVQPTAHHFDHAAIEHYVRIAQDLVNKGIKPMVCLHHYSDPTWFMDHGGFSKEENIAIFMTYCNKMYKALSPYVSQWIVISQPVAYAVKGYKVGMQPPFLHNSGLEDIVMLNMFKAHIAVYDMMHNQYRQHKHGLQPEVGLCHQVVQMYAARWYHPLDQIAAASGERIYNQTLMRFFTNGHFQSLIPMRDLAYIPEAPTKFDFFALSYYCPSALQGISRVCMHVDEECKTADPMRVIYKEGIYDAIVQASKLGKPIYVVESGIDPKHEAQRILFLDSYLSAIAQALVNGYDVRGYYHWTLMDNYEWGMPTDNINYGLYKNRVQDHQTGKLHENFTNHASMLKDGGKYYKAIIAYQKQS